MNTKEELNALKEEVESLNKKLRVLTEEELKHVTGGKPPLVEMKEDPASRSPSLTSNAL